MLGYCRKYGRSFYGDQALHLCTSLSVAHVIESVSFMWFFSSYHMATSRVYNISILHFVSFRVCNRHVVFGGGCRKVVKDFDHFVVSSADHVATHRIWMAVCERRVEGFHRHGQIDRPGENLPSSAQSNGVYTQPI